jgi:hypothetical protein
VSSKHGWPADVVAAYDQYLAETDAKVSLLVRALQAASGAVGEHQAMADVSLLIPRDPDEMAGLLIASIRRLARDGG